MLIVTIEGPDGTRTVEFEDHEDVMVGRDDRGAVVLSEPSVSRHHVRLTLDGTRVRYEDRRSFKGTWLVEADGAERRVTSGVLEAGQRLRVVQWRLAARWEPTPPRPQQLVQ